MSLALSGGLGRKIACRFVTHKHTDDNGPHGPGKPRQAAEKRVGVEPWGFSSV